MRLVSERHDGSLERFVNANVTSTAQMTEKSSKRVMPKRPALTKWKRINIGCPAFGGSLATECASLSRQSRGIGRSYTMKEFHSRWCHFTTWDLLTSSRTSRPSSVSCVPGVSQCRWHGTEGSADIARDSRAVEGDAVVGMQGDDPFAGAADVATNVTTVQGDVVVGERGDDPVAETGKATMAGDADEDAADEEAADAAPSSSDVLCNPDAGLRLVSVRPGREIWGCFGVGIPRDNKGCCWDDDGWSWGPGEGGAGEVLGILSDVAVLARAWDDDEIRVVCEKLELRKRKYTRQCKELGGRSAKVEQIFLKIWELDDSHLEGWVLETWMGNSPAMLNNSTARCNNLGVEDEERDAITNTIQDFPPTSSRKGGDAAECDQFTALAPLAFAYWVEHTSTGFRHAIWKMDTFNHLAPLSIRELQFLGSVTDTQEGKELRPVEYMSRKMPSKKSAKSTNERELYALYKALVHWRHYLLGRFFYLRSDHQTLKWIKTQPVLFDALKCWIEVMDQYDFKLDYVKGEYNKVADALSRRTRCLGALISESSLSKNVTRSLGEAYKEDPITMDIINKLKGKDEATTDEFVMVDGLLFLEKAGFKRFDQLKGNDAQELAMAFNSLAEKTPGVELTRSLLETSWEDLTIPQLEKMLEETKKLLSVNEKVHDCLEPGCGRRFATPGNLRDHMNEHSGEKPYKCTTDGCGARFPSKQLLCRHMKKHERAHVCTFEGCGKRFAFKERLVVHQKIHSDERPLTCPWEGCGKTFKWPNSLHGHMRTHTGEKPFKCMYPGCGRLFGYKVDLTRHNRTHNGQPARLSH
ncbi:hypothetical protein CBR_g66700 [Chara braunii]|nr:hypothetical protein CBR_g66700 [Chara braunii]|eukprot:GBG59896.1 hypothetical protein CBR_g66700 [Chara braunii]